MWLTQLAAEFWMVLRESAVYILFGFLFAAALHVVMDRTHWGDWLKSLNARSVFLAAVIASPLPLCSCSVIPAAVSLRKRGASKGSVLSFLISAPETNVESITLTWGLLGPVFAITRPIAGLVTAFTAGLLENFFERRYPSTPTEGEAAGPAGCACDPPATTAAAAGTPDCCAPPDGASPSPTRLRWRDGMRHAFVDVFDDVVGWMIFGVLVAAIINVVIPGYVIDAVFGPPLQAMLIMLAIGIPLYVCAEASTPIAAALVLQGVNPGAALVFLLAGPATNIGSLFVLKSQLGRRTVIVYLATIAVVAVIMGLLLDWICGVRGLDLSKRALAEPIVPLWLKSLGAAAFLLLAAASAIRMNVYARLAGLLDRLLPVRVTPPRLTVTLVVAAILGYLASGFVAIQPGQVGMIKIFGRVVAADVRPGLHYAPPYPFGSLDRVDTEALRRVELGTRAATSPTVPGMSASVSGPEDSDRTWVLLGDENLANIKCAAHWRMRPGESRAFAYGTADPAQLVEVAVRAALRSVLGDASIDTVLTTDQVARAADIHQRIQQALDRCASGIEVVAFHFLDLHAPPEVHEAFRDVASALEDRVTRRNQALTRKAEIEPLALGDRDKTIRAAQADLIRTTAEAAGEADAFRAVLAAYLEYPELTRDRLILEMYDRVLPGRRKFIRPSQPNLQLDLRFGGSTGSNRDTTP